ncbi:MAG: YcbK family protein, partial [Steroidobacteraceae bacterium]|nr:YcbK family protein [Steroidobacteraceae bacterium]
EAEQPGSAAAEAGDDSASESPKNTTAAPSRHKKRGKGKRSRRPVVTGRVVPEEQLRQNPLPRPSGRLHLIFPGLKDEVDVNIYNADGSYNLDAMQELSHVLRCRRTDAQKLIDPQLLMLLSHVSDHFGGKPLEVVSGYRNQRKVSSNHVKGTATDFRIHGVPPKKIREFAETLDGGGMGIGLYPVSGFVHIDVRPAPSYRWLDYSPPNSNASEKRPPRGWKRKKLQS